MEKRKINQLAADLVRNHAGEIDLVREFSYGRKAKSMIEATDTGIKLGYKIINTTSEDKVLYLAPLAVLGLPVDRTIEDPSSPGDYLVKSIIPGLPESDVLFIENPQLVDKAEKFQITPLNSKREVLQLRGFATTSPVQITSMHMVSRNVANNNPDTTNYQNPIKSFWLAPFYDVEEEEFQLRTLLDSSMNSPQFAEANFVKEKFNAFISNQHVLAIQINAGTELTITAGVGAYDARPERFFRKVSAGNKVLQSIR